MICYLVAISCAMASFSLTNCSSSLRETCEDTHLVYMQEIKLKSVRKLHMYLYDADIHLWDYKSSMCLYLLKGCTVIFTSKLEENWLHWKLHVWVFFWYFKAFRFGATKHEPREYKSIKIAATPAAHHCWLTTVTEEAKDEWYFKGAQQLLFYPFNLLKGVLKYCQRTTTVIS